VVVLAESMGTVTGLVLVKRRPDLFHALVVTDLYVNMAATQARKYQLTLERLRAAGTTKGVAALRPDPAARRELDRYYTPELFWTTAERIPDARLRLYAGKGHARIATLRHSPHRRDPPVPDRRRSSSRREPGDQPPARQQLHADDGTALIRHDRGWAGHE
jgi:pimeloyl-ACP methyl ester carboxylesterase